MKKVKLTHPNLIEMLKGKVTTRSYTNKEGQVIILEEIDLDLVEQKKEYHKEIYKNDKFSITKTGKVAISQSKEEKSAKADKIFVGEVHDFEFTNNTQTDKSPF